MGNDWFHEYFINELKAIGRKPTSNMQHEVVDSLPSSGNEQTIYFVKNDSSSTNDYYDEYVWISSSSTFEKIGSSQIDGSVPKPLTYDYMPEGYPSKSIQTETIMEEQTLSFKYMDGLYSATLPVSIDLIEGQTYIVTLDGIIYECLCKLNGSIEYIGSDQDNTGMLIGDEPFCVMNRFVAVKGNDYIGLDAEHTIGITTIVETVTPMAEEFLPNIPADKLPAGGVTTLHVNVTAINTETMEAIFTADKTPKVMQRASVNGPTWCVITFEAGTMDDSAVSIGLPPAWIGGEMAFGFTIGRVHEDNGNNKTTYAVREGISNTWVLDLSAFGT